jgi:tRNA uridine 5-carboxymethylaminomethyl modification enzyme
MTSRAEYRLLLRQDNADLRLREKGYRAGIVPRGTFLETEEKRRSIEEEIERISKITITPSEAVNAFLAERNSTPITTGIKLKELIKRPEMSYMDLSGLDTERPELPKAVAEQVNIVLKYEGYIARQMKQAAQFAKLEFMKLPPDTDYNIDGLRLEARQKLNAARPENLGAASRITGVSPADISVLMIYLERKRRARNDGE